MIFDYECAFGNKQAVDSGVTFAVGTTGSTNYIDRMAAGAVVVTAGVTNAALPRDLGIGEPVEIAIDVTTAFTSGGSATMDIRLVTDDNTSFSSPTTIDSTGAIAVATLVAGYKFARLRFIPTTTLERYVRINYVVATANMTAGNITAGIVAGKQMNPSAS